MGQVNITKVIGHRTWPKYQEFAIEFAHRIVIESISCFFPCQNVVCMYLRKLAFHAIISKCLAKIFCCANVSKYHIRAHTRYFYYYYYSRDVWTSVCLFFSRRPIVNHSIMVFRFFFVVDTGYIFSRRFTYILSEQTMPENIIYTCGSHLYIFHNIKYIFRLGAERD